jgi:serine/threonine protein kinase
MARILDIAVQVAWGLHFSHQKGLVHQDVKPGNVLMTPDGTAKVSDFGLASARMAAHEGTTTTRKVGQSILVEGAGFLTPEYASPEQFAGQPLSTASDAWSWAVLVLEMLKGECDWADGRATPFVLQDFYQDKFQTDPLAQLLHECLLVPVKQRSSSLLAQAEALIRIYENLTGETYPRNADGPNAILPSEFFKTQRPVCRVLREKLIGSPGGFPDSWIECLVAAPKTRANSRDHSR